MSADSKPDISCIILAGGEGRRVSGQDKGLVLYKGRPLIEHVVETIKPQVDHIVISANRNLTSYQQYSEKVVSDDQTDYMGPLAGIAACLPYCSHPLTLIVACDLPLLPDDLVSRLYDAMAEPSDPPVISIATVNQRHQLALLIKTDLQAGIEQRLAENRLKLIEWVESQYYKTVAFDDQAQAFANLNTLAQLG
jgi:molybdopterin-guanine dinucleotide biosynthesis protein A